MVNLAAPVSAVYTPSPINFMRSKISILLQGAALVAAGWSMTAAGASITVADLQRQLAGGVKSTFIDVRSPELYSQAHIPGAINIPASLCPLKNLPPLGQVVVYGDGLGREAVTAVDGRRDRSGEEAGDNGRGSSRRVSTWEAPKPHHPRHRHDSSRSTTSPMPN